MSTSFDERAYLGLVAALPLRPVRSERELDRATEMIDSLLDKPKLTRTEQDYLDVLTDLIERYESQAYPAEPASDAEMLAHLLEARDMTQTELAAEVGIAPSTISSVLRNKRKLRREHVTRLAAFFSVSPAVFLLGEVAASGKAVKPAKSTPKRRIKRSSTDATKRLKLVAGAKTKRGSIAAKQLKAAVPSNKRTS